ncbi:MAG TPA: hypothetical protein VNF71_00980 [Acidimicrobiales bacterium]|nr:hypothetical protein [Acidimicrobiales bacterium]
MTRRDRFGEVIEDDDNTETRTETALRWIAAIRRQLRGEPMTTTAQREASD